MNKKLIGAALVALPLAIGGFVVANSKVQFPEKPTQGAGQKYVCPITGEELPCEKCCPLNTSTSKVAVTNSKVQPSEKPTQVAGQEYVCPVTEAELPCEKCCPLNTSKSE